jgi:hypothetical protein
VAALAGQFRLHSILVETSEEILSSHLWVAYVMILREVSKHDRNRSFVASLLWSRHHSYFSLFPLFFRSTSHPAPQHCKMSQARPVVSLPSPGWLGWLASLKHGLPLLWLWRQAGVTAVELWLCRQSRPEDVRRVGAALGATVMELHLNSDSVIEGGELLAGLWDAFPRVTRIALIGGMVGSPMFDQPGSRHFRDLCIAAPHACELVLVPPQHHPERYRRLSQELQEFLRANGSRVTVL